MLMESELYRANRINQEMNEMIRNEEASDRLIGEGVKFQRIRRITGYLVGTLDRFNNAKRAEVGDRVSHG